MLGGMRVRTTIFLLLLLAGTAFVAGLYEVRRIEREKSETATAELQETWEGAVRAFWDDQGRQLQGMVDRMPAREGVVQAILDKNKVWAAAHWDESMLSGFGAQVVWVYQRDGALFYSLADTQPADLQKSPIPAEALAGHFGGEQSRVFYVPLASSIPGRSRVVEVRGTAIRPQYDTDRKQSIDGYFLAGRIWDDDALHGLLPPGNGEARLMPPNQAFPPASDAGVMWASIPLRDWRGQEIGQLAFRKVDPRLTELHARGDRIFRTMLIGALVLFVVLALLLERAIVWPLRRVIRSLNREDLSLLEPLAGQKAEFGQLARLIDQFFAQQTKLVREMLEHSAAEKALRESEEMLRHSQKMEAVGRLAGGVAHDFNNLLTAIIGYADLLRRKFAGDAGVRQPADLIHQAGEQAAGLTRQLLAFSRKQLLQPKIIDLNTIVTNLQRLLQRIIGEHIEIITEPAGAPACVKADPGQIEQVIVNLGVNARDAMPRGGRLWIRTRHWVVDEAHPVPELPLGSYVAIEVTDTGEGMDPETKARIFEPFFTTKGPGKGTGLGLATVYGIVKQSHGTIVVESERGIGSTFRILLPQATGPLEVIAPVAAPSKTTGREESVLIVEDEEIVRALLCEILRDDGYRVRATGRGSEALRLAEEEAVDLLISDVVMPEMNGADVGKRVHQICPKARVLFVSGYSENDMADQGMESLAFQVLQKPFTPETLVRKVREILDGAD
jgi:signal transduction histidine kinase/CheY-like chemotaxis protein